MSDDPWDTDSLQDLAREVRLDPDPAPPDTFYERALLARFAMAALPGVIATIDQTFRAGDREAPDIGEYASDAFRVADAMLAEWRKRK